MYYDKPHKINKSRSRLWHVLSPFYLLHSGFVITFFSIAVYCPDGEQLVPSGDDCELCPRGTYKDNNEGALNPCKNCPEGVTTSRNGSTSIQNCNIGTLVLMMFSHKLHS